MEEGVEVALRPRRSALRKIQHRMISGYGLVTTSVGREPRRHLVVYRTEARLDLKIEFDSEVP
jgi:predicted RNA-binding protein Jag